MPPQAVVPTSSPEILAGRDRFTDAGLVALTLIWGSNFVVVKGALEVVGPLAFNALRFPLACVVLWVAVRRWGTLPRPRVQDIPALVALALLGNVAYQLLFIYGIDGTRAGNAALLLATVPIWALLLAALSREGTLDRTVWVGVALTFGGVAVMVIGGTKGVGIEGATLRGDLLMLLAALSWAGYTVGARRLILRYGALPVTAWTLWGGSLVLVLLGLPELAATDLGSLPVGAWAAVTFAGVFALGIAYLIWYRAVHRLGSARTAAFSNAIPIVALIVAWLGLGERPTGVQVAGAGIILAGIVLARWGAMWKQGRERRQALQEPEPPGSLP